MRGTREKTEGFEALFRDFQDGVTWDPDARECPVPVRMGGGRHCLYPSDVEGDCFCGEHHSHLSDCVGGHLDDLRGPEYGTAPVQAL